jgi:hypothetical protein
VPTPPPSLAQVRLWPDYHGQGRKLGKMRSEMAAAELTGGRLRPLGSKTRALAQTWSTETGEPALRGDILCTLAMLALVSSAPPGVSVSYAAQCDQRLRSRATRGRQPRTRRACASRVPTGG